ncbi:MAG UNVERIFIED_CONTAM: hypothetical protein LVR29_14235 [Microcystis novacekii LVE1205-3]
MLERFALFLMHLDQGGVLIEGNLAESCDRKRTIVDVKEWSSIVLIFVTTIVEKSKYFRDASFCGCKSNSSSLMFYAEARNTPPELRTRPVSLSPSGLSCASNSAGRVW